ncbi:MAG: SDR family oxidoreductase, partial [Chloroflexi bacterium]|nr:SDR family oxidoreductase [Chloroflexota bacterium]
RDPAKGEALAAELEPVAGTGAAARLVILTADPADRAAMDRAVESVMTRWGRLDALANLAGGSARSDPWDVEAIARSWEQNVRTAVTATAACLRPMRARAYGRIVSVGAKGADRGGKDGAAYAMAKTALVRWTESLAAALKDEGITANVVQPGIIDHPDNRAAMPKADPTRWVRPEELAAVIVFLSTSEASGITGAAIPVTARV